MSQTFHDPKPITGSIAALKNVDALPDDLTPAEAAILDRIDTWRKLPNGTATGRRDDLARAARCSLNHVTKCLRNLATKGHLQLRARAKYCLVLQITTELMTQGKAARQLWQKAKATGQHLRRARAMIGRAIRDARCNLKETNPKDRSYTFPQVFKKEKGADMGSARKPQPPKTTAERGFRMHGLIPIPL